MKTIIVVLVPEFSDMIMGYVFPNRTEPFWRTKIERCQRCLVFNFITSLLTSANMYALVSMEESCVGEGSVSLG